jgi:hypothetical protein
MVDANCLDRVAEPARIVLRSRSTTRYCSSSGEIHARQVMATNNCGEKKCRVDLHRSLKRSPIPDPQHHVLPAIPVRIVRAGMQTRG